MAPLTICIFAGITAFVSLGLTIAFAVVLGIGISRSSGDNHLVDTAPSYTDAARITGHYDEDGTYLGGTPSWNDWTEDSFACLMTSNNGAYCQEWSTERYYNDPEEEYLEGICLCVNPPWTNSTAGGSMSSSSSPPANSSALQDSTFCVAWDCDETRYTRECVCAEYKTTTTCSKNSRTGRRTCTDSKTCVRYDCYYVETKFYSSCDCDPDGIKEETGGDSWWRETNYCRDWSCDLGSTVATLESQLQVDAAGTSSATESAASAEPLPINASMIQKATVTTQSVVDSYTLVFTCLQASDDALLCNGWRGVTSEGKGDYVEQLCECSTETTITDGGNATGFCSDWSCTTYEMAECEVCSLLGGILLGGMILPCMIPIVAAAFKRRSKQKTLLAFPLLLGGSASMLLSAYMGGTDAIILGALPIYALVFLIGGIMAYHQRKSAVIPVALEPEQQKEGGQGEINAQQGQQLREQGKEQGGQTTNEVAGLPGTATACPSPLMNYAAMSNFGAQQGHQAQIPNTLSSPPDSTPPYGNAPYHPSSHMMNPPPGSAPANHQPIGNNFYATPQQMMHPHPASPPAYNPSYGAGSYAPPTARFQSPPGSPPAYHPSLGGNR